MCRAPSTFVHPASRRRWRKAFCPPHAVSRKAGHGRLGMVLFFLLFPFLLFFSRVFFLLFFLVLFSSCFFPCFFCSFHFFFTICLWRSESWQECRGRDLTFLNGFRSINRSIVGYAAAEILIQQICTWLPSHRPISMRKRRNPIRSRIQPQLAAPRQHP